MVKYRIVLISDTHGLHNQLEIPECDILIHAGDITKFSHGGVNAIKRFLYWFDTQKAQHKIFIAGNHDRFFEQMPIYKVYEMLPENVTYLQDTSVIIDGIKIYGSPVSPYFRGWAFNKSDTPPYGILDLNAEQSHVGCRYLIDYVNKIQPSIHVFGHIHPSYGFEKKTVNKKIIRFYNTSSVNNKYEVINKPFLIEFDK